MTGGQEQLQDLLDRFRNRFFGKYRGTVTQVDEATLRLKAKVPAVLLDQESGWCLPCVPYAGKDVGFVFLPEPGAGVWIEFEGGDPSYPIWSGCYWRADEAPADGTASVKAIVTPAKQKILLDGDGGTVTISDDNDNVVTLASSGITAERGGKKVEIGTAAVKVNDGALEVT
ncbi:MAG TPA: phage baseplate assembly protein V [Acidimicrobiales bacterium]|nr:phage baseplate assembly protein V [Acidimicrobiales bacterium]